MSTPQNPQYPGGFGQSTPPGPDMAPPGQGGYPHQMPQPGYPQQPAPQGPPSMGPAPTQQFMAPYAAPQPQLPQTPAPPPYYGAPVIPPPEKKRTGLIVTLVILVVAIGGIAAAYFTGMLDRFIPSASSSESASASPSASVTATKPKDVATEVATKYLEAIAAGKSADALALVDTTNVRNQELLSDEALKDSLSRAPITDIVVEDASGYGTEMNVRVTYKVGNNPTSDTLFIDTQTKKIDKMALPAVNVYGADGYPVAVNGVKVTSLSSVPVFPGSYSVTSANEYIEISGDTEVILGSSTTYESLFIEVAPSEAGIDLFREKVAAEAKTCLDSKQLDPGCGMAIGDTLSDGTVLTEGSISRIVSETEMAKLDTLSPELDWQTAMTLKVSGYLLPTFEIEATCTETNGTSGACQVFGSGPGTSFVDARIDLADPDLKVVWGS